MREQAHVLASPRAALFLTVSLASAADAPAKAEELIGRMKGAWDHLAAYRTTQVVQERVKGELGAEQRVKVAFRKPWESSSNGRRVHPGRKVYWSAARHDGEVQVYPGGLAGRAVGILSFALDNRDPQGATRTTPPRTAASDTSSSSSRARIAPSSPHRPTLAEPVASTSAGGPHLDDRHDGHASTRASRAPSSLVSDHTGLPRRVHGLGGRRRARRALRVVRHGASTPCWSTRSTSAPATG